MKDCFGREIDYLRISITDRCNLRCRYCMPDGMSGKLCHEDVLRYEEFLRIVRAASRLGIRHLKVTGGEPLVRRGCPAFIGALKAVEGIQTVTLTTNGLLLRENLDALVQAGVDGINVSLDTTDPQQYRLITGDSGAGGAEEASAALLEAAKRGIRVKVNAVTMPGTDVLSLISFAREHPVDVRFIEMMPIGYGRLFPDSDNRRLIARLAEAFPDLEPESEAAMELLWEAAGREKAFSFAERHSLERITKKHGEGPAVYFHIPGYQGSIGFISAVHGKFCSSCNRIRLTSTGFLKTCLCYDQGADLRAVLRDAGPDSRPGAASDSGRRVKQTAGCAERTAGCTDRTAGCAEQTADCVEPDRDLQLEEVMRAAILKKPAAHCFETPDQMTEHHEMSQIGG